ncbi:hypothetical protein [Nocardioides daejeonensis]|uniref:hypothetical protein n=1 Tax=Nocardioides daejeonensis TaxID=1046556 RepID=UPI0013A59382|nr:hypothetical protein [Nocardioides daejeonensis]
MRIGRTQAVIRAEPLRARATSDGVRRGAGAAGSSPTAPITGPAPAPEAGPVEIRPDRVPA